MASQKNFGGVEANITDAACPQSPCPPVPTCPTPVTVIPQCGGSSIASAGCCEVPSTSFRRTVLCAENNKEVCVVETISQVFKTGQSFCMPGCGQSVRVYFPGISDVAIGAFMWANGVGSLRIKGFNARTQEIELENTCSGCDQVPAGTPIATCTPFVLSPPDCSDGAAGPNSLYPFLASGFTAPVEDACIDVSVTNVNGLSVNKTVSINSGIYRISAIKSATVITICNDGSGLTPGTIVDYQDGEGNFVVPVILIDSNPCLNTPGNSGVVLVCKNNVITPIVGTENGQVLVYDSGTGEANWRTLGLPLLDCTELTVCLTLDPALDPATPYLTQVLDTADFVVGQILLIGGTQFTVDSILSGTQIYLVPVVQPTAIQTYNIGATLCSADCCTILSDRLDSIGAEANSGDAAAIADATLTLGQAATGNVATLLITNASLTKTMGVNWQITSHWIFDLEGIVGKYVNANIVQSVIIEPTGVAAFTTVYNDQMNFAVVGAGLTINRQSVGRTYHGYTAIPPNSSMVFRGRSDIAYLAGDVTDIIVRESGTRLSYLGVALL